MIQNRPMICELGIRYQRPGLISFPSPSSPLIHMERPTHIRMEEIRNKKTKGTASTPSPAPAAATKPPAAAAAPKPVPIPVPTPVKSVPAETKEERESYDAYDVE